jgi:hypothetical protein
VSVYVDPARWPWKGKRWGHLLADDVDELHAFARRLGLKTAWFQTKGGAHYDITEHKREQAIAMGAVVIDSDTPDEYLRVIRQARVQAGLPAARPKAAPLPVENG